MSADWAEGEKETEKESGESCFPAPRKWQEHVPESNMLSQRAITALSAAAA